MKSKFLVLIFLLLGMLNAQMPDVADEVISQSGTCLHPSQDAHICTLELEVTITPTRSTEERVFWLALHKLFS